MKKLLLRIVAFILMNPELKPIECNACGFVGMVFQFQYKVLQIGPGRLTSEIVEIKRCPKCKMPLSD